MGRNLGPAKLRRQSVQGMQKALELAMERNDDVKIAKYSLWLARIANAVERREYAKAMVKAARAKAEPPKSQVTLG